MNQAGGAAVQTRNPVMVLLITMICAPYGLFAMLNMLGELRNYTGNQEITPWHLLIPYYNLYLLFVKVPKWMGEAKAKAGSPKPAMGGFMYFLVAPYAMAADLNDVAAGRGALPAGQ